MPGLGCVKHFLPVASIFTRATSDTNLPPQMTLLDRNIHITLIPLWVLIWNSRGLGGKREKERETHTHTERLRGTERERDKDRKRERGPQIKVVWEAVANLLCPKKRKRLPTKDFLY